MYSRRSTKRTTPIVTRADTTLNRTCIMSTARGIVSVLAVFLWFLSPVQAASPSDLSTPEAVIRALVQANVDEDLTTMATLMAHGQESIGYSVGGRSYEGWEPFAREMEQEFGAVEKLEIPILDLKVWTRDSVAWFAMELDYIRYVRSPSGLERTVLPLRETGVLERREGKWILISWHESSRGAPMRLAAATSESSGTPETAQDTSADTLDLSGNWLIEEEDKSYTARLDASGNGPYTHQGGSFRAVTLQGRRLAGTWQQTGNDREGGFEVLFSEDGNTARGVWWYTRVGTRNNIPPKLHGGTYVWRRVPANAETNPSQDATR